MKIDYHSKIEENVVTFQDIGPQGGNRYISRFYTVFKDISSLRRTTGFPIFAYWMGKLREVPMEPIAKNLVPLLATGKYGLVTNYSKIQVLGEANALDLIEGSVWIPKRWGKFNSSFDLNYEWRKILPNGKHERIATSQLTVTWTKIKGHGLAEVADFPDFMKGLMDEMSPKFNASDNLLSMKESFSNLNLKKLIFKNTNSNDLIFLHQAKFITSLEDANLIGNVYFARYYTWQKRTIDAFLYTAAPNIFQGIGEQGELITKNVKIDHLREAMPFDQISVKMYLISLFENGLKLFFEYYRVLPDGSEYKLAIGEQESFWMIKGNNNNLITTEFPKSIIEYILNNIKTNILIRK